MADFAFELGKSGERKLGKNGLSGEKQLFRKK